LVRGGVRGVHCGLVIAHRLLARGRCQVVSRLLPLQECGWAVALPAAELNTLYREWTIIITHTHTHTHGCTAATHLAHGAVVIASRVQAERSSLTYKRVVVVEASEVAARPYLQGAFWIIAKALAARVAEVQPTQLPTSAGKL
jgi:hypothetical protein